MKTIARTIPLMLILALSSCGTIDLNVDRGQVLSNLITNREQFGKATTEEGYTPEQEYYIGRGVAARILGDNRYKALNDEKARKYVNLLGLCLAWSSTMPETFQGWHFLVLDSTEINAFSAPSGFVLASRELLRCAKSEDEVAAILAHEIGHVALRHGIDSISAANKAAAFKENTKAVFKGAVTVELPFGISIGVEKLGKLFNVSVLDIVETLANKGYSREQEYQADAATISILQAAGYDPRALVRMLEMMQTKWKKDGPGFMKTHPSPAERIKELEKVLAAAPATAAPTAAAAAARQARYQAALGKI